MDKVKINLRLKPEGEKKLPLSKLSQYIEGLLKFLENVSEDLNINMPKDDWTIESVKNASVGMSICSPTKEAPRYSEALNGVLNHKNDRSADLKEIKNRTIKSYYNTYNPLEMNDEVYFMVLNGNVPQNTAQFNMKKHEAIQESEHLKRLPDVTEDPNIVTYHGSIRGVVQSWFKESNKPHITIKESISNNLAICYYDPDKHYIQIHELLEQKNSIVILSGEIKADIVKRRITEIQINQFEIAPEYQEGDLEKFIGCMPGAIGDLTAKEFIENLYNNE